MTARTVFLLCGLFWLIVGCAALAGCGGGDEDDKDLNIQYCVNVRGEVTSVCVGQGCCAMPS